MINYEFHPIANTFPLMSEAKLAEFAENVRKNGFLADFPLILLDGMILDGRNRYRACQRAGVDPPTKQYDGNDPIAFVVSLNLHRRHLNATQRAIVASKIANMHRHDNQWTSGVDTPIGGTTKMSHSQAAKLLNVGKNTVQRAGVVRNKAAPHIAEAMERGDLSVDAAYYGTRSVPKIIQETWSIEDVKKRATETRARQSANDKPPKTGSNSVVSFVTRPDANLNLCRYLVQIAEPDEIVVLQDLITGTWNELLHNAFATALSEQRSVASFG